MGGNTFGNYWGGSANLINMESTRLEKIVAYIVSYLVVTGSLSLLFPLFHTFFMWGLWAFVWLGVGVGVAVLFADLITE